MASITNRSPWKVVFAGAALPPRTFASRAAAKACQAQVVSEGLAAEVSQGSEGPWRARVRRVGAGSLSREFATRREAEKWARSQEAAIDEKRFVDPRPAQRHTLASLLLWHAERIPESMRPDHDEWHRCGALARHPMASVTIDRLRPAALAAYRDQRLRRVRPSTVIKELNLVHKVIERARRELDVHVVENPAGARCVKRPALHEGAERTRRLQGADPASGRAGEQRRLLASCRRPARRTASGKRIRKGNALLLPFVRLALETMMRRGELLKLEWAHVHLERGYLDLPKSITKNRRARLVPLTLRAKRVLAILPRAGVRVFEGQTTNSIACAYERARRAAGLEDLRLHDLRHEGTSRLFENTDLRESEIAQITGHRDLRMLARYTHLRPDYVVQRFASSFKREGTSR